LSVPRTRLPLFRAWSGWPSQQLGSASPAAPGPYEKNCVTLFKHRPPERFFGITQM